MGIDSTLNAIQQRDAMELYNANKLVFNSQIKVRRVINIGLNLAVPKIYRRTEGARLGSQSYKSTDCPHVIIYGLRTNYSTTNPTEKEMNASRWSARWNPSNLLEELFDRLKECYAIAIVTMPPYTMDQIIDKSHIAVQHTGLYKLAILEWNGFDPANRT